jgi:hypothetical protein
LTIATFLDLVILRQMRHPRERLGQAMFNCLSEIDPVVAEKVRGIAELDPFYIDANVDAFLAFLSAQWEVPTI